MRSRPRPSADIPKRLAILFALYAAVAIPLVATLVPPFQAADELAHAERAEQIGNGALVADRSRDGSSAGGIVDSGLERLSMPFDPVRFHPRVHVDAGMRRAEETGWGNGSWSAFPNTAIYPPWFYLPASLGLHLGRELRLSVWHAVILSRLLTGLASTTVAASAIALAGGFAPMMFTLLCLPMSLALFAAVSQDGLMIAGAALGSVLLAGPGRRKRFWAGCVLVAAVAAARPPYLPLCLAPLLASNRSLAARVGGSAITLGAIMAWVLVVDASVLPSNASHHMAQQLAAIRHDPWLPLRVLRATLDRQLSDGLPVGREFIGVLGWLDTTLPNPYYALAGCALLTAMAASRSLRQQSIARTRPVAGLLVVASAVAAVYASQYLSWSTIGGSIVDGVQGRYFLPLAPFLVFATPAWRWMPPRILLAGLAAFPCLSIALTMRAIMVRYYGGW